MLIVSLKLSEAPRKLGLLTKAYSFCFTVEEARQAMKLMSITVQRGSTVITIVCGVPEDKVVAFLHRFMHARLLHSPAGRTQDTLTKSILIQPTAKGLFFVQRYCARNGIRDDHISKLLLSPYNSMRCITLERDPVTDAILTSGSFSVMIFQRFLGSSPNVYDPANPPDPIPPNTLASISGESPDIDFHYSRGQSAASGVSPYAHRYFTHPDSESLTQYYVSNKGVRVFRDKQFAPMSKGRHAPRHDFVLTGKAAWQWFMECTDIVYPGEAAELATLFLQSRLIVPIMDSPSIANFGPLVVSRDAFYHVSDKGKSYCLWSSTGRLVDNARQRSSDGFDWEAPLSPTQAWRLETDGSSREIALDSILNDAGLRLLFREHLERNVCQENFLFYTETEQFLLKFQNMDRADARAVKDAMVILYAIFNRYFAPRAPFELNLAQPVKDPLVELLSKSLDKEAPLVILDSIAPLLVEVQLVVRKLLSQDSVPKFLRSREYQLVNLASSPVIFIANRTK